MIRTGEADFITTVPLEQIKSLEADETLNVTAIPSIMQKHLDLNNFFKPFSDKRVRQAINYAINKDALVKVAYNGYAVLSTAFWPVNIRGPSSSGRGL